ncbi:Glu/Leu/Phe/Val dehydrogenase [Patescibacteria group bacterium]|nr:Glu/Leu/Phe/Val dehydrogenase [Patescibacteria group bacterium]
MERINPFNNALKQLKESIAYLGLDEEYYRRLSTPEHIIEHPVTIVMDSGESKTFQGYRVQFNNALGPYKGGIRFHPLANIEEVKTLAFLMALKCAVVNIPMGGGKGGVQVNPKNLSAEELERLSRAWVKVFFHDIGPDRDIPAPDMYTNPQIMAWMADEYSKLAGHYTPASFTGKPVDKDGSEGREFATSQGGFYALTELVKKMGMQTGKIRVVIQGFGNVGYHAARILHEHGYKVVAVSDSRGGIYVEQGFNPDHVMQAKRERGVLANAYCHGTVCDNIEHKKITNKELLELECDILIPAALENQITEKNADKIKARAVVELANGAITPEADTILDQKRIPVVPDVLANAGGVVVSYFEWQQNLENKKWTERKVLNKLEKIIKKEFNNIWIISRDKKVNLRTAAFILGIGRLVKAIKR